MNRAMGKCHKSWSMMWSVTSLSRTTWACVPMEWKSRHTLKKILFNTPAYRMMKTNFLLYDWKSAVWFLSRCEIKK